MAKEDALESWGEGALTVENAENSTRSGLVQITTYIREDQVCALELMQTVQQERQGSAVDQAELIQEALDLLIKANIVAIRVGPDRLAKKRN